MSKTITLSDLEIATAVAALRVLAAEPATTFGQREALERLAQKLQEPVAEGPSDEPQSCPICNHAPQLK